MNQVGRYKAARAAKKDTEVKIVKFQGWYHREDIARYARIQREGDRLNTEQRVSLTLENFKNFLEF